MDVCEMLGSGRAYRNVTRGQNSWDPHKYLGRYVKDNSRKAPADVGTPSYSIGEPDCSASSA